MEDKQKVTEAFGLDGVYFKTKEEAEKFNNRFHGGQKKVQPIKLFDNCDDYIKVSADDALERLCEEKFDIINCIKLPFNVEFVMNDSGKESSSDSCTLKVLKMMVFLANKKLKEEYTYPREVNDDYFVEINSGFWSVVLKARQFMTMYDVFKQTCQKINDINGMIKSIIDYGNYDEDKYKNLCKKLLLKEKIDEPYSFYLDMLEKDSFKDKDYLELE